MADDYFINSEDGQRKRMRTVELATTGNPNVSGVVWLSENGAMVAKATSAAYTAGDFVLPGGTVRKNTAAPLADADGDYQPLITDAEGKLWVTGVGGGGGGEVTGAVDATIVGTPSVALVSHTTQNATLYTGGTSRIVTPAVVPFTNEFWKGMLLIVDVTAGTAGTSVTPKIQIQDPVSAGWRDYWIAGAAIVATTATHFKYLIYPGMTATGTGGTVDVVEPATIAEIVSLPLPRTCRLEMTHANANGLTYSVGAVFLV